MDPDFGLRHAETLAHFSEGLSLRDQPKGVALPRRDLQQSSSFERNVPLRRLIGHLALFRRFIALSGSRGRLQNVPRPTHSAPPPIHRRSGVAELDRKILKIVSGAASREARLIASRTLAPDRSRD